MWQLWINCEMVRVIKDLCISKLYCDLQHKVYHCGQVTYMEVHKFIIESAENWNGIVLSSYIGGEESVANFMAYVELARVYGATVRLFSVVTGRSETCPTSI